MGADGEYEVTRVKVLEFAAALGESHPVYWDHRSAENVGYANIVAPPTFPVVITMGLLQQFLAAEGFPLNRVVHGGQSFAFHRPIVVGDVLTSEFSVSSRRSFGGNEIVVTTTSISTVAGESVVQADATLVLTAVRDEQGSVAVGDGDSFAGEAAPVLSVGAGSPVFPFVLSPGVELPEIRVALRRVDLVRYAGAAGDFNPIHFSDHAAVALGLPGVIAHGMLTMGLAGRVVTRVLDDPGRLTKLGVRFTNPVLVPDNDTGTVCEFTGTVGQTEDADFHTIALKAASGSRQVLGQAKAVVRI